MKRRIIVCIFLLLFCSVTISAQTGHPLQDRVITELRRNGTFSESLFEEALENNTREQNNIFIRTLFTVYCNEYFLNHGTSIPSLDRLFLEYYTVDEKILILKNCGSLAVFNEFSDILYEHLAISTDVIGPEQAEDLRFALLHYEAKKIYKTVNNKAKKDWEIIFSASRQAMNIRPLETDIDMFLEAAKKLKKRDMIFRLKAYRYYSREGKNLIRRVGLFFTYLVTSDKEKGFKEALMRIRKNYKSDFIDDIRMKTPKDLPPFPPRALYTPQADRDIVFDFFAEDSIIYDKQLVILFFSSHCSHCFRNLELLSKLYGSLQEKGIEVAAINTNIPSKKKFAESVADLTKRFDLSLPMYTDIENGHTLLSMYKIDTVPIIMLFDSQGKPLAKIQFYFNDNLEMKFAWLLDTFFR